MTILKSKLFDDAELEVIQDNDTHYIAIAVGVSPFVVVDDVPNYFIFNKETGKIEGMSQSLHAAKAFLDYIEIASKDEATTTPALESTLSKMN